MDDLFPVPSPPPSKLCPRSRSDVTAPSTQTVLSILRENHERWHCFTDRVTRYHNHVPHWVLSLWSLGADEATIEAGYQWCIGENMAALIPSEPITVDNIWDHVGDDRYYAAYLKFFRENIQREGVSRTLEEYIFSPNANFTDLKDRVQSQMLHRAHAALLHPLIDIGHGAEFGLPGLVAEGQLFDLDIPFWGSPIASLSGLALAAIEKKVTPNSMFLLSRPNDMALKMMPILGSSSQRVHAFTILARILQDTRFDGIPEPPPGARYKSAVRNYGDLIGEYVTQWALDTSDVNAIEEKLQELIWTSTIIYGVGGWSKGKGFKAILNAAHLVTSVVVLPATVSYLTPSSAEMLLRGHLATSLALWISLRRPALDLQGFFSFNIDYDIPMFGPSEAVGTTPAQATESDLWTYIIKDAIQSDDYHITKIQRAFLRFAELYGARKAGLADFVDTKLPGAECMDGTLFVRVAYLTAKRVGRPQTNPLTPWDIPGE
ncbi:hypothetical protein AX16_009862 [Volvariella volvacea WC 439]|nr:hypothetical protein AX16_009862 [Volvariella volvacea WC 439]